MSADGGSQQAGDRPLLRIVRGDPTPEELAIVIAGVPPGIAGTTNALRVHRVGAGSVERTL